ncbi:hypothetical protein COLO4_22565 [Corchorus olitorius]|uniref:START domain-containing protein n=1 Tax=Corchorus olitorius TaxID=93759 RepID=A0A1R3ILD9_9ROSI|nr:hypothetical protein COLO4_22565 [Corchorus olitorius]
MESSCGTPKLNEGLSSVVTEEDLKHLWQLVEMKDGGPSWIEMMDRSTPNMKYQAWRRDPKILEIDRAPPGESQHTIKEAIEQTWERPDQLGSWKLNCDIGATTGAAAVGIILRNHDEGSFVMACRAMRVQ